MKENSLRFGITCEPIDKARQTQRHTERKRNTKMDCNLEVNKHPFELTNRKLYVVVFAPMIMCVCIRPMIYLAQAVLLFSLAIIFLSLA